MDSSCVEDEDEQSQDNTMKWKWYTPRRNPERLGDEVKSPRRFPCPECNQVFASPLGIFVHRRFHSNQKPEIKDQLSESVAKEAKTVSGDEKLEIEGERTNLEAPLILDSADSFCGIETRESRVSAYGFNKSQILGESTSESWRSEKSVNDQSKNSNSKNRRNKRVCGICSKVLDSDLILGDHMRSHDIEAPSQVDNSVEHNAGTPDDESISSTPVENTKSGEDPRKRANSEDVSKAEGSEAPTREVQLFDLNVSLLPEDVSKEAATKEKSPSLFDLNDLPPPEDE